MSQQPVFGHKSYMISAVATCHLQPCRWGQDLCKQKEEVVPGLRKNLTAHEVIKSLEDVTSVVRMCGISTLRRPRSAPTWMKKT